MKKEIGSEFWEVPLAAYRNNLFHENVNWFISGRSALSAIVAEIKKENRVRSVSIPGWCCDSMILPFLVQGIEVNFYNPFSPVESISTDALLMMDYFGFCQHTAANGFHGIIIQDTTHSLFTSSYCKADYCFGSMRKWAGFYSGGYAWGFHSPIEYDGIDHEYLEIRKRAMDKKGSYIRELESGMVITDKEEFLKLFSQAENRLSHTKIQRSDPVDIDRAIWLDIDGIKQQRRKNAAVLLSRLREYAMFPHMEFSDCPLFVPILVDDRDRVRRHFIYEGIYCPVHWPLTRYHNPDIHTKRIYEHEISLVCDQRYDETDMERILSVLFSKESGLR